ncbi:hypothetical protein K9N08_00485 [Candidatus Gracilibacteria bacterium]|nr:hypothetical protein [Candidatus Gracilibacteria bacterium]MCF7856023.1 hypothetical protein [Candidatus Gracilibacteria bacterium]MCF7896422.1 hypothetical protein [Candidatus Gracilibacteria bacterium]
MKSDLKENVWKTICWFDLFAQPVSLEEIHRFLLSSKASKKEVEKSLAKDSRVGKSFGFYFVRGKNASVLKRCGKQYHAGKLWKRVLRHLFILRFTPFLKLVAVGNTLAMGFPERNSDIDLLVVTKQNRLFTTRAFLTFFAHIFRMRRSERKIRGRFCLSFFLTENSLNLEKIKIAREDIYLAFWVATLTPIFGDSSEIFAANNWVREYFPNLKLKTTQKKFRKKNFLERILSGKFGDFLERILRNWQLNRAMRKQKNREKNAVIISEDILKFHETDQRKDFQERWKKRVTAKSEAKK